jgi:hypothetical protein
VTVIKRHGKTARVSRAALELTDSIHTQGSDVEKQSKTTILWYATEILVLGRALSPTDKGKVVSVEAKNDLVQEPAALVGLSEPPVAPPPPALPSSNRRQDNRDSAVPKDQAASATAEALDAIDKHNPAEWIRVINSQLDEAFALYGKSVEKLIVSGLAFSQAKKYLGYGRFGSLFGPGKSRIDQDTAEKLINIVNNRVIANSANHRNLPPALNTLHRLSHIDPVALQKAIDAQRVSPMMTARAAAALSAELDGKTQVEPEKDLDYFRKTLGGYLHRKISPIANQELRHDVIAELLKLLQGMTEPAA